MPWIEPLEGTKRLLTALDLRDNEGTPSAIGLLFAKHRLSRLKRAHALVRQSSLR